MSEMLRMAVVLTVLASVAGGVLAAVNQGTAERIEAQQLAYVKGPAIRAILEGAVNDPLADRRRLNNDGEHLQVFPAVFEDGTKAVAFEQFAKGYGGELGLMVAIDLARETVRGAAVTVHSETPGLGARAKAEPDLVSQFSGLPVTSTVMVTKDGGQIDAISGATITSRAVCEAVNRSLQHYQQLQAEFQQLASTPE